MSTPPKNDPPEMTLTGAHRSPEEKEAIGLLMANVSLPGMGTWMAGKRLLGAWQLVVTFTAQFASVGGLIAMATHLYRHGTGGGFTTPGVLPACGGIALFLVAWVWALLTSLGDVRRAQAAARERETDPSS